jgi:hypothetical protein
VERRSPKAEVVGSNPTWPASDAPVAQRMSSRLLSGRIQVRYLPGVQRAPVAQRIRVSACEAEGQASESPLGYLYSGVVQWQHSGLINRMVPGSIPGPATKYGGCSSTVEHLVVAQGVAGSRPAVRPQAEKYSSRPHCRVIHPRYLPVAGRSGVVIMVRHPAMPFGSNPIPGA